MTFYSFILSMCINVPFQTDEVLGSHVYIDCLVVVKQVIDVTVLIICEN